MWRDQALTTGSVQEEGRVCERLSDFRLHLDSFCAGWSESWREWSQDEGRSRPKGSLSDVSRVMRGSNKKLQHHDDVGQVLASCR